MVISNFLGNPLSYRAMFRWYESITSGDGFARVAVALALILPAVCWWAWALVRKRGAAPPPPGPRGLPLLGQLPFLDSELQSYFSDLASAYGPILQLRLGTKVGVVVSSPALARAVLKEMDVTFANRDVPDAALEATYGASDLAWSQYGPQLRMLRRVCVRELLSSTVLDTVSALRHREMRQTVSYLYDQAGSPVNIEEQTFLTVLNVLTSMLWGGTVEGEERKSLGAEFRKIVTDMTALLGKPNLSDFYPVLARFDLQGIKKQMKGVVARFDSLFNSIIEQRMKMDKEDRNPGGKDFLQHLLNLKDEEDSKTPFTMTHLKALLMDMVVGGTDTTSDTVEFAMAEIMNKPEVMRKVEQELEAVVGKDNIVEDSHLPKLPYLHAVVKETLRLHAPLPLLIPHSPSEPCVVGGFCIPKGARVFINVWRIHRDPSIWENPTEFDPERFLRETVVLEYNGSNFNYFPFGSGRRMCVGIAMAERMMMLSLATLLHSFHWELLEEGKLDLSEKFGIVLKMKEPLVAIPTPKLSDPRLYE